MQLKTVPQSRILRNLEGLFPLRSNSFDTVEQYLEALDALPGTSFPFNLQRVRVLDVELAVINGVLHPSSRRDLVQFLTETPEDPVLVTDLGSEGKASLFFAIATADKDVATAWMNKMNSVTLLISFWQGDYLIAAPVSAFS